MRLLRWGLCLALLFAAGRSFAVPMPPWPIEVEDVGGYKLLVRAFGDEHFSWVEDLDGFALARDESTLAWHFARQGTDGRLVATQLRVGAGDPRALGLTAHLRPSGDALRRADELRRKSRAPLLSPMKGMVPNLVLLVKFKNQSTMYTPADFDPVFNGSTDSVRAYYDEVSRGAVQLASTIEPWFTLAQDDTCYAYNDARPNGHAEEMVKEAIAALDAQGFDFKSFDANGDGVIDAIDVIHSGPAYESTLNASYVHSHFAPLATPITTHDGVRIVGYHTEGEIRRGGGITPIGGICHETAHFFGLPDLYDTTYASSGLGLWCLMSAGSWGGPNQDGTRPSHLSAWAKMSLGFLAPRAVVASSEHEVLQPVEEGGDVVRLDSGMPASQYFLLENRRAVGSDQYLPGEGLLIFHVDERMMDNSNANHYLVDLEQADGLRTLNTSTWAYGDAPDAFPNGGKTLFTPESIPNSQNYGKASSKVYVTAIAREGTAVSFDFTSGSAVGVGCLQGDECGTGFCVGGMCCDQACDGACTVCALASGADRDGHCTALSNVSCDDRDACTRRDICSDGKCIGGDPVPCAAASDCHPMGACDPATGKCSAPQSPDGTACSQGFCVAGECQSPRPDAGAPDPSPDASSETPPKSKGCGCASASAEPVLLLAGFAALAILRRRRGARLDLRWQLPLHWRRQWAIPDAWRPSPIPEAQFLEDDMPVNMKIGSTSIPVTPQTKQYDADNNGVLEGKEIAKAVAHGINVPEDQIDIAAPTTIEAPVVYSQESSQILNTYAPNWKGDFNVPGTGAGNIHTGRDFKNGHDAMDVIVNCDLMDKGFLDGNIASATLVVMPKGNDGLQADIPLQVATAPGYQSYSRGGGSYSVPDKKFLAASIDTASLRDFGGNSDLSFYVRLNTKDGQTLWINKDGKAYNNFEISKDDLKPQGTV